MPITGQQKNQMTLRRMKNPISMSGLKELPKVRVQYIKNYKNIKISNSRELPQNIYAETSVCNEPDSENVEYLECSKPRASENSHANKHNLLDNFYPNAVLCLISLYKSKYDAMKGKSEHQIKSALLWEDIAYEMNESYFKFSRKQIQQKYSQLREKYFSLTNVEDILSFEYFDQMHEIYQDRRIDAIAVGGADNVNDKDWPVNNYVDEIIYAVDQLYCPSSENEAEKILKEMTLTATDHNPILEKEVTLDTHSEIVHKEHEFLDMIEKGCDTNSNHQFVQERENDDRPVTGEECILGTGGFPMQSDDIIVHENANSFELHSVRSIKRENEEIGEYELSSKSKRFRDSLHQKNSPHKYRFVAASSPQRTSTTRIQKAQQPCSEYEFTLLDYNEQQERRHQERLELLRQGLSLQERLIQQNSCLIEELLKRL